jgi:hypothetical protein
MESTLSSVLGTATASSTSSRQAEAIASCTAHCVVCVVTVVSHSFDAGLTAGTYALGFATIPLATMTILSAIRQTLY